MNQKTHIKIEMLKSLARMPEGYAQAEESLIAEVSLAVDPRPTRADISSVIAELEQGGYAVSTYNSLLDIRRWAITASGKLALAQV